MDWWITGLLDCWIIGLLDCWIAGWLDGWMAGWLDGWIIGLLDFARARSEEQEDVPWVPKVLGTANGKCRRQDEKVKTNEETRRLRAGVTGDSLPHQGTKKTRNHLCETFVSLSLSG
jgi:hypothetical protein